MEFDDKAGQSPTTNDVVDALWAVRNAMHPGLMMKLPPELAVNLPNIRRCLLELQKLQSEKK